MGQGLNQGRRHALRLGGGGALLALLAPLGLLAPATVRAAANDQAFAAKTVDEALSALGIGLPQNSAQIRLEVPEVAENGAVVPVVVESSLANTQRILLLSDRNPTALIADYEILSGVQGYVSTRIKMAETARVIAVVKAGGKLYRAAKEVQITIGGCA